MSPFTLLDRICSLISLLIFLILSFAISCQSDDRVEKEGLSLELRYFKAIDKGNIRDLEACIAEGIPIDKKDALGNSGLIHATDNENIKLVEFLLEKGANVNLRNTVGETALFRAVFRGNLNLVKYLVERGAETKIKNAEGVTPVHLAEDRGEEGIQKYLENLKK
jgi:ankyrin repeat protein